MSTFETISALNNNNYSRIANLMTPGFVAPAMNNGSLFNYTGVPSYAPAGNFDMIEYLLKKGAITEKEANDRIREIGGFKTENAAEGSVDEIQESLGSVPLKFLDKARTSNSGAYKVNEAHAEVAKQYVKEVKNILKKDPSKISEAEAGQLKDFFSSLTENPMLADAFITQANKTSFRGKNSNVSSLLGSYEQALTKLEGKGAAKEEITQIKEDLETTVSKRNSAEFTKLSEKYNEDEKKIEYTFVDRLKHNPKSTAFLGLTALGGVAALGLKYHAFGKVALIGAAGLGLLAAGTASVQNILKD